MSTTIRTTSEKQMNQIRRFVKKNKNYCTITQENGVYAIAIIGLTSLKQKSSSRTSSKPTTSPKCSRSLVLLLRKVSQNA